MSYEKAQPQEFAQWVIKAIDGTITPEEFTCFQEQLKTDPRARQLYLELVDTQICLDELKGILPGLSQLESDEQSDTEQTNSLFPADHSDAEAEQIARIDAYAQQHLHRSLTEQERVRQIELKANQKLTTFLAEQERQRQMQARSQVKPIDIWECLQQIAQKTQTVLRVTWKTSKKLGIAAVIILAVLLSIQAYHMNRVVATLGPNVHAKWSQTPEVNDLRPGTMELQEGVAEIVFKKGTRVLVQAPCAFELVSSNGMELLTGTITAEVPERARGFTVETPWSDITDYGTAFGVSVDDQQNADILVFDGRVGIQSTVRTHHASPVLLEKGQNARTDQNTGIQVGAAQRIAGDYMRALPTPAEIGIPGKQVNLADIVGGGRGYGNGQLGGYTNSARGTINPATGRCNDPSRPGRSDFGTRYDMPSIGHPPIYTPVPELKYVDGVFVPNGNQGPMVVTSQGDLCYDCPNTSGRVMWNINNGWRFRHMGESAHNTPSLTQSTGISMHTNVGITFDLNALRGDIPHHRLACFKAQAGIPLLPLNTELKLAQVDVWVLVDGEVRAKTLALRSPGTVDLNVPLETNNRFLTLMVTDGASQSVDYEHELIFHDWLFIENPVITLRKKSMEE